MRSWNSYWSFRVECDLLHVIHVISLSEYSDENMMDAHNLAVCFGPTLMPIQSDHNQMRSQNYVNELIRILIVHQEAIFPKDGGPVYEKCIVEDDGLVVFVSWTFKILMVM